METRNSPLRHLLAATIAVAGALAWAGEDVPAVLMFADLPAFRRAS
jgi:hypothetical protein